MARLETFLPKAAREYATRRNSDFGPGNHSAVSVLSPWIRHRLVSEEEVVRETLKRHSFKASEKFVQEVFWRSYFKGWLEQRPGVWDRYCRELHNAVERLEGSAPYKRDYNAAVSGNTGIECFDFWAKELVETGYLHNHARMWFASIWIFTLNLPWVLGADFFFRHLLDGDPASNTCSWRWVGGRHTKGKNYVARASNIEKFTDGRFNPSGQLNENPLPLSEYHDVALIPPPQPEVWRHANDDPYILLVSEEDCLPETLINGPPPAAVIGISFADERSPLPTADHVNAFVNGAIANTLSRCEEKFGCETIQVKASELTGVIATLCEETQAKDIATAFLPAGPAADHFKRLRHEIEREGMQIHSILRPYDQACWPHATKGFFKLKEKIPVIVGKLGLN